MAADLENTTRQIIARLDDYLPEFNTSLMDGRLQDVVLKHPIVRSLLVPPADQAARRRCIDLISRAVAAATPVLPLILQDQESPNSDQLVKGVWKSILIGTGSTSKKPLKTHFRLKGVPNLPMETQTRLLKYISELSKREPLTEFWMTHHTEYQQMKAKEAIGNKRHMACSLADMYKTESTLGLYLRLKIFRDILVDIGDRVQGTVCKVFWEYWDEIYIYLAGVVGDKELEHIDDGRLFRMSGDAALYVDNQASAKKRKLAEQQRLSIIAEEENYESTADTNLPAMALMSPIYSSVKDDIFGSQSDSSSSKSAASLEITRNSTKSSPGLSATPESLIGEDSFDESSVASGVSSTTTVLGNGQAEELPLIDASELNFMMKSGVAHGEQKPMSTGGRDSSSVSKEGTVLDLRARIKMMEEDDSQSGYAENMLSASSQIVW